MNVNPNAFLAAIRAGKPQIGVWVGLSSPFAAEIIAGAGFDWAMIDMEHSPNDLTSVLGQLQAFAPYPTTAMVRPEWNDAVLVKRLLDIGAPGLLFPMVQSVDEAKKAVAATRYPPHGIRGVSTSTRANKFGRVTDYFTRSEDELAVLLQVETRAAVNSAVDIGQVQGCDGVFFGPADIGADMGLLGQPAHPDIWDFILPAAKRLMAAGIPVGTLVGDSAFARRLLDEGFTFVACGVDTVILSKGVDALLGAMKA
jgi:4-hydroxy-2-oxoheptanedioate aldolase